MKNKNIANISKEQAAEIILCETKKLAIINNYNELDLLVILNKIISNKIEELLSNNNKIKNENDKENELIKNNVRQLLLYYIDSVIIEDLSKGNIKEYKILNIKTGKTCIVEIRKGKKHNFLNKTYNSLNGGNIRHSFRMNKSDEIDKDADKKIIIYCAIKPDTYEMEFYIISKNEVIYFISKQHKHYIDNGKTDSSVRELHFGFESESYKCELPTVEKYKDNIECLINKLS